MFKQLAVAACAILFVVTGSPQFAVADGGPSSGYISPAEQARAAAKRAQVDRRLMADTPNADSGEVIQIAASDVCGSLTTYGDYVRVVNAETLSSFYVQEQIGGQSRYNDVNSFDIATYRHPLAPALNANGLPGWGRDVAHFVTVKQYWISGNTTTYGDTAGFVQSGSNASIGWHVWSLTNLYQVHIQPIGQFSFDTIVW